MAFLSRAKSFLRRTIDSAVQRGTGRRRARLRRESVRQQAPDPSTPFTTTRTAVANQFIPPTQRFEPEPEPEPEPQFFGGGGFGGGAGLRSVSAEEVELRRLQNLRDQEKSLQDAISVIVGQIGALPELRPPEFDEAAARVRSEAEFNPFFKKQLDQYLKVVGVERRRRREDFGTAQKRAQEKLGIFFKRAERQEMIDIIGERRAARLRGIVGAGVAQRQAGLGDIQRTERRQDVERSFEQQEEDRKRALDRFTETSQLQEEAKRETIEEARKEAVEKDVESERIREEQEFAKLQAERASQIGKREQEIGKLQEELSAVRSRF